MGYLALPPSGLDMSKVTISFWFRVSRATMDKLHALVLPRNGAFGYSEPCTWPVLQKTLTFLSWGQQPQGTVYWNTQEQIGFSEDANAPNYGPIPTLQQTGTMPPCYLGMAVDGYTGGWYINDDARATILSNEACFVVNLQTDTKPTVAGVIMYVTSFNVIQVFTSGGSYFRSETVYTDYSYTQAYPCIIGGNAAPNITADAWHHVLISWNIRGTEEGLPGPMLDPHSDYTYNPTDYVISPFKMYFALDDQNYTGNDLPANWYGDTGNMNGIVTSDIIFYPPNRGAAGLPGSNAVNTSSYVVNEMPAGSYTVTLGQLAASRLYVPGFTNYEDDGPRSPINSVFNIEMAELQIYSGVMLDTSSVGNRRLFVDARGKPVPPATAQKVLGKPSILLHGNGNWIKGKDTGTAGNFTPTGTIKKYTPEPQLGK